MISRTIKYEDAYYTVSATRANTELAVQRVGCLSTMTFRVVQPAYEIALGIPLTFDSAIESIDWPTVAERLNFTPAK